MSSYRNNALLVAAGCLCAGAAGAVEYTATAIVDQRLLHDDNILMFPDTCRVGSGESEVDPCEGLPAPEDSTGYELAPQFRLRARAARWEADGGLRLRYSRFDDGNLDSDDQFLDASVSRLGERSRWDLEANLDRTNTRNQVLELVDILFNTSRVESWRVSPAWSRTLTEKDSLVLSGTWGATDYDAVRLALSDYDYYDINAGWRRQLDEKSQVQVSLYRSTFESGENPADPFDFEALGRKSETDGLQISYTRQFSESFTGSFAVGGRRTDSTTTFVPRTLPCVFFGLCEIVSETTDNNGFTASFGMDYRSERWSLGASVSRTLVPNGLFGGLLETDRLTVDYTLALGPRLDFTLTADGNIENTVGTGDFERDRWQIQPGVNWQFAERWRLTGQLRHRTRDFDAGARRTESDSTAIIFRVRYTHPRARWSR